MSPPTSYERRPSDGFELTRVESAPTPPVGPPVRRLSVIDSIRRHPLWLAVPAVVLLLAGIAAGLSRTPTYTAEASLILASQETTAAATGDLASAYSRAIIGTPVVRSLSKQLKLPRRTITARLSASPSPNSPVIRVIATGETAAEVIRMANAGSSALRKYLLSINTTGPDNRRLFRAYRAASARVSRDNVLVARANAFFRLNPKSKAAAARFSSLSAVRDTHRLSQQALGDAYSSGLQNAGGGTKFVAPLTRAFVASSDRTDRLQLFGFVGLMAGLIVGLALAVLRGTAVMRSAMAD